MQRPRHGDDLYRQKTLPALTSSHCPHRAYPNFARPLHYLGSITSCSAPRGACWTNSNLCCSSRSSHPGFATHSQTGRSLAADSYAECSNRRRSSGNTCQFVHAAGSVRKLRPPPPRKNEQHPGTHGNEIPRHVEQTRRPAPHVEHMTEWAHSTVRTFFQRYRRRNGDRHGRHLLTQRVGCRWIFCGSHFARLKIAEGCRQCRHDVAHCAHSGAATTQSK